jgi:RNA polymerase sigma factor (sigma-70 family)
MNEAEAFAKFLSRLRANDEAAAKRFVDLYSPVILQAVGRRLAKCGLTRVLDPEDIAQQVFAQFFARVLQQRKLASSQQLIKLLVTMTVAVLRDEQRHAHTLRRSSGKQATENVSLEGIVSPGDDPSHEFEIDEEINQIHKLLSEEEWALAWARASGNTWPQIATAFGQTPDALRRKLSRARARIRDNRSRKSSPEAPPHAESADCYGPFPWPARRPLLEGLPSLPPSPIPPVNT